MHALSQLYDLFPPFLFFFSRSISSLHLHVLIPKSLFFYPLFSCFRTAGRGWPRYPIIPFNHFNPCGMKSRTIGLHTCAAKMEILISWWAMMPMQLISKETESGRVWERERVCVCVCVCVCCQWTSGCLLENIHASSFVIFIMLLPGRALRLRSRGRLYLPCTLYSKLIELLCTNESDCIFSISFFIKSHKRWMGRGYVYQCTRLYSKESFESLLI